METPVVTLTFQNNKGDDMVFSELFNIEVLSIFGLILDFLGAGLIIAADFSRTRELLSKISPFDKYEQIINGFEEAKESELAENNENFWPVLEYLLQYPGDLNYDGEILRPRTMDWHAHMARASHSGNPTVEIQNHPLYWAAVEAQNPKITYSDDKDRIIVQTGEGMGEFSRWHDTHRIQSELYTHFIRLGSFFLFGGFLLQLFAYLVF